MESTQQYSYIFLPGSLSIVTAACITEAVESYQIHSLLQVVNHIYICIYSSAVLMFLRCFLLEMNFVFLAMVFIGAE